ncbi:MAG: YdeI/OmpD-associated family protein [Clostridia bacterium]|nr:YdeI/OmpD-associated family protein [Clostridia bacterium]
MENEIVFKSRDEFRNWLIENHDTSNGIWLVFEKGRNSKTIKAEEALLEALCFGWIDGQLNSVNDEKYIKRFTPRRKGSNWSPKNRKLVDKLIQSGMMTESGLKAVEAAQKDGHWDMPGPEPIKEEQIEILINALAGSEPALSNFLEMSMSIKKTYTALYLDAKKEETRVNRLRKIIERLNDNKKPM